MGFRTSLGRAFSAATNAASKEWHESQLDRRITGDVIRYDDRRITGDYAPVNQRNNSRITYSGRWSVKADREVQVLPSALPPAEIGTAQHKDIMFTAVAYIKLGGFDHGVSFGPEFATEALAWHWLHGLAEEACSPPPHDYIEVEPVSYWSVKAGWEVQTLPQLLPPVEMGTTQQENPVTNTTASFTEKEFKLLELAVYTAIRQGYHEGVSQEHINELSELRYKLLSCVSEANYYAVSWSV